MTAEEIRALADDLSKYHEPPRSLVVKAIAAIRAIPDILQALEFYADQRRYDGPNQGPIPDDPHAKPDAAYIMDVTRDHGTIAAKALRLTSR